MQGDDDRSESLTSVVTIPSALTASSMTNPTSSVGYDVHLAAISVLVACTSWSRHFSKRPPFPSNSPIGGMYACRRFVATKWRRSLHKQSDISGKVSQTLLFIVVLRSNVRKEDVAFGS
jgi:hypothetical protein